VLLYHRVARVDQDPLRLCVTPEHFREQMAVVADSAQVIAMDELAQAHRDGRRPTGVVAITFDDGYHDNIDALTNLGLPVTLFAATGHVASGIPFFWDEAAALLLRPGTRPPRLDVATEAGSLSLPTRTEAQRRSAVAAFHGLVQRQPADAIEAALAQLRAWAGWAPEPRDAATRLMTPDELAGLSRSGVTIGAHTRNHVNLAHQTAQVVRSEIEGSRDDVAAWTGRQPAGFSYPFGIPRQDVDATARDAVEATGFAYAVVNQPVPVAPDHDRFLLPRIVAPDLGADAFRAWLASQTRSRAQTALQ
jgi:peptidoglycan/xylan/chitin deacetylase (PgdA/CDA1 family)